MVGLKTASIAILATVCVGIVNVLATIVALWLLDRVGRRPLLLIGLAGMVLGLGALAVCFHMDVKEMGWITFVSLGVYVAAFAIGIGPVFWVLIAEIYPLSIRGKAMGLAAIANWAANLIVALTFLSLIQEFGPGYTFGLYALIGSIAWIFSFFLVPETKGYSLEEIQTQNLHRS
jgi:MFS family permease